MTIKVLDDFGIPTPQENAVRNPALISRQTPDEPTYQQYRQPPQPVYQQPVQQPYYPPQQSQPYYPPQQSYAPPSPTYSYAPQAQQPTVIVVQAPQPVYMQPAAPTVVVQQGPTYPPPAPPVVVAPYGYGPARFAVPYRPRYYAPY